MTVAIYSAKVKHQAQEFGETEGMQLILVVFLIFGLAMVPAAVPYWMLPVAISLIGAKLDWQAITFIGWFGPRGIASVLYLLMAVAAIGQEEYEQVMSVIVLTVAISVYAHGICATPLSLRYGASRPSLDR
jgi:NhaP-type Na+/H+ or K+/H+ antiporter